jgi:2,4-dienoyl-CoA reductase (NADPH2)
MARGSHLALLFRVGATTLPNRIVMGSMHTGLECHPERFAKIERFYSDRARGGVALIVTGAFAPNHAGPSPAYAS